MGWFLKIVLKNNKKLIILFNFIRLGIIKTKDTNHKGYSIMFGIWRIEFQFNMSLLIKRQTILNIKDIPHA